jgi:hypothetical protein
MWVAVAANASFCVLQVQSNGPVLISVSEFEPSVGDSGMMLLRDGLTEISFFDLAPEDTVYAFTDDTGEFLIAIDNGS